MAVSFFDGRLVYSNVQTKTGCGGRDRSSASIPGSLSYSSLVEREPGIEVDTS